MKENKKESAVKDLFAMFAQKTLPKETIEKRTSLKN